MAGSVKSLMGLVIAEAETVKQITITLSSALLKCGDLPFDNPIYTDTRAFWST